MSNIVVDTIIDMLQERYGTVSVFDEYNVKIRLVNRRDKIDGPDLYTSIRFGFADDWIGVASNSFAWRFSYHDLDPMFVKVDDLIKWWRVHGYVLERDYVE